MSFLERYENLVQIGSGSMGTVYRARDKVLDRDVALKMMRTGAEVEPEVRERFYQEAKACARLQHPNIVAVHDLGEDGDLAYIVMEYLPGADLRKVIEQRRPLPFAVQLQAMIDVCEALEHAHRHGVIHRDVKPSNLLLLENNRVKVMDFGIARLTSSRMTMAGKILGTPNYMAPEQILGQPCDARADLFSASIVFFELVTGSHPFRAEVVLKRIVEGEPDSIFDHTASVPEIFEKIMTKGLDKNLDQRYATATQMLADLQALLDAVKQNATPRMSGVQLPSERNLVKEEVIVPTPTSAPPPVPPNEDAAEWRLSEVLRLIPAFEDAVDRGDQSVALQKLNELRAIAAVDRRFVTALQSCEDSYAKTWPADRQPSSLTETSVDATAGSVWQMDVPEIETTSVSSPTGTVAVQAPQPDPVKEPPPNRAEPEGQPAEFRKAAASSVKDRLTASLPEWLRSGTLSGHTRSHTLLVAGIVGTIAVLLLASVLVKALFPVRPPLLPHVGSAIVQAGSGEIKTGPSDNSASVSALARGATVSLLEVPPSASTQWLRVQYADAGKASNPGFIQISSLSSWPEWRVDDPQSALQLAKVMQPAATEETYRITQYIEGAQKFADRQPVPVADEIKADVERLKKEVESRKNPPAVAPLTNPPVTPAPSQQGAGTNRPVQPLLSDKERAQQIVHGGWNSNGDYERMKKAADRALKLDPQNPAALRLKNEADKMEKLSRGTP
jgi:serine/threonine protein kinase